MTTALIENELVPPQDDEPDTTHLYCCVQDMSLCGLDLSGAILRTYSPELDVCIVCDLLTTCSACGKVFEL